MIACTHALSRALRPLSQTVDQLRYNRGHKISYNLNNHSPQGFSVIIYNNKNIKYINNNIGGVKNFLKIHIKYNVCTYLISQFF